VPQNEALHRTGPAWRLFETSRFLRRPGKRTQSSGHNSRPAARFHNIINHHHKIKGHDVMNQGIKRSILRWIHIVFGIPIIGYIYSPFEEIPQYAPAVRFVFLPVLVLSGLWMWKGHVLRRLISKGSARQDAADNLPASWRPSHERPG
jgi:hypothetical protein